MSDLHFYLLFFDVVVGDVKQASLAGTGLDRSQIDMLLLGGETITYRV